MLEIQNLSAGYGGAVVIHDISLRVEPSQIVCLLGSNGAGKSTILRAITGLAKIANGDVRWEGESLLKVPLHEMAPRGISLVPEDRLLFLNLSVYDNLIVGSAPIKSSAKVADNLALVHQVFPRLSQRHLQLAGTLSGGEQQMLTIGRALMASPKLLMLDEPTIGLAPHLVHEIFEAITQLRRDLKISVLLAEQHADQALMLSDYAYVIDQGSVAMADASATLADDARVREVYLGVD